jgi:hypothetical protein
MLTVYDPGANVLGTEIDADELPLPAVCVGVLDDTPAPLLRLVVVEPIWSVKVTEPVGMLLLFVESVTVAFFAAPRADSQCKRHRIPIASRVP